MAVVLILAVNPKYTVYQCIKINLINMGEGGLVPGAQGFTVIYYE